MSIVQNISVYRGEDIVLEHLMQPVVDITGWALIFTVRKELDELPIVIQKTTGGGGIVIVDGPAGRDDITLLSADTAELDVGDYLFDIQRDDVGAHRELTTGTFTIVHPVRNITPP